MNYIYLNYIFTLLNNSDNSQISGRVEGNREGWVERERGTERKEREG